MKICDWCSEEFQPRVSYQIYCSAECRESATKEKVGEKYRIKKRKKLSQKERKCSNGCGTILSVYNDTGFCSYCAVDKKQVSRTLKELKGLIDYERFE
jgi:hypothetical protein